MQQQQRTGSSANRKKAAPDKRTPDELLADKKYIGAVNAIPKKFFLAVNERKDADIAYHSEVRYTLAVIYEAACGIIESPTMLAKLVKPGSPGGSLKLVVTELIAKFKRTAAVARRWRRVLIELKDRDIAPEDALIEIETVTIEKLDRAGAQRRRDKGIAALGSESRKATAKAVYEMFRLATIYANPIKLEKASKKGGRVEAIIDINGTTYHGIVVFDKLEHDPSGVNRDGIPGSAVA